MDYYDLGVEEGSGKPVRLPRDSFKTHYHLIGGTGKGKTTALHTLLQQMLSDSIDRQCFFIIDKLGNFSYELLLWMTSAYCPQHVRDRLVYIQAANEDVVCPINPFIFKTDGEGYYKCERATEIILRGWESQSIDAMPRLARWLFNAFWAAAQLGLTISDCQHFLRPGSKYHEPLLDILPTSLKAEWDDVLRNSRGIDILDSSRNRLRPYFDSNILRRMFGSTTNRLDVLRMMQEKRIVLVDLAPYGRVGDHLAATIGSLLINEIIATVRTLPMGVRYPTYLFLDEFQNFVGPDVEAALPELRNLGLRMILSHQSLSQLRRGTYDMTNLIFAAQSRMIFGLQGRDADLLAEEVASLTFDPYAIKGELYTRRQLTKGHKKIELHSWSDSESQADTWSQGVGKGWSKSRGESVSHQEGHSESQSQSASEGTSSSHSEGFHESRSESHTEGTSRSKTESRSQSRQTGNAESTETVGQSVTRGSSQSDTRGRSSGRSSTDSQGKSQSRSAGTSTASSHGRSSGTSQSTSESGNTTQSRGGSKSQSHGTGRHEAMLAEYDEFMELANRTYFSFDEQKHMLASEIRKMKTGRTLLRLVNDEHLYHVNVTESRPGFLDFDPEYLRKHMPACFDRLEELKARNYESDFFVSAAEVDREMELRLQSVLQQQISVQGSSSQQEPPDAVI